MEEQQTYQKDIESIRKLMERSSKFISLSGLSGILAGIYALLGALAAYSMLELPFGPIPPGIWVLPADILPLLSVAVAVLVTSLLTGLLMSSRKAKQKGIPFWDATARRLSINLAIPLVVGGLFILLQLFNGHISLVAPSLLIFYGLALINASPNLFEEIRYLGYSEIILGLVCGLAPRYGLIAWVIGFGVFHILYGAIMYRKYE